MPRTTRKTFRMKDEDFRGRRLININISGGISWREAFEACVGFLSDEDMPSGHFAAADLELLIEVAQERLRLVNTQMARKTRETFRVVDRLVCMTQQRLRQDHALSIQQLNELLAEIETEVKTTLCVLTNVDSVRSFGSSILCKNGPIGLLVASIKNYPCK